MDRKIQRESQRYVEKQFKKYDTKNMGAIPAEAVMSIMTGLSVPFDEEELKEMMDLHLKESTYVVLNKQTRQFDIMTESGTVDFPSVMAICVHFLKKQERRNTNEFASKGLVRLSDMPSFSELQQPKPTKLNKKLY